MLDEKIMRILDNYQKIFDMLLDRVLKIEKKFKRYNSKDTSKLCSKCWDKIHHKKNYSPVKRRHNKCVVANANELPLDMICCGHMPC